MQAGRNYPLASLCIERTDHGVCVTDPKARLKVDLVEHLFSALAALHAVCGVQIEVVGKELPLLDGAARRWLEGLEQLSILPRPATHAVMRAAHYECGASRYQLAPASDTRVDVLTDFGPGHLPAAPAPLAA